MPRRDNAPADDGPLDAEEIGVLSDRAGGLLLHLALCAATATLLLALASSLGR